MSAKHASRRWWIGGVLGVAGLVLPAVAAVTAQAQTAGYPQDVVTLVTHSSPGGGSDVFLREMINYLGPVMGVDFVVENVRGGSGAKAMAKLASAPADGSIFYATTPTFIYTSLLSHPDATYRDLEPLVNFFLDPEVIYTSADSSLETLGDVLDDAKQGGGKWGAANPASLERQILERLKKKAGVNAAIVTFEGGGDMMINVLNGTLDIGVGEVQEIRPQLEAGKLRLIGSFTDQRLEQYPDLPTVKEQGVDLVATKFRGLAGPKGLPADVIAAWEAAVPKLLADPKYKALYTENNLEPKFIPHEEYVKFVDQFANETETFLKEAGVIQ